MKRWMAIFLAVVMLLGTAAFAQEDPRAEMTELTKKVKQLLEIPDDYDDFFGDYTTENGQILWNLNWQGQNRSAYVTCDSDGRIYNYSRYESDWYSGWSEYEPRLPENTAAEAEQAADAFLTRVLGENESYVITDCSGAGQSSSYFFSGYLLRSGIATEIQFYLEIRSDDLTVSTFSRYDSYMFFSEYGADVAQIDNEAAASIFQNAYQVELRYVSDGQEGVRLAYMPVPYGGVLVDALTGEILSRSSEGIYAVGGMGDTAAEASVTEETGLTQAELEGIAQMEGVKSEAELDTAARSILELGLTGEYQLSRSSFSVQEGRVVAQLFYTAGDSDQPERSVTLDARELTLMSAWASHPYKGEIQYSPDTELARTAAEAFVAEYFPEKVGKYAFSHTYVPEQPWSPVTSVYFVRVENGVWYEGNTIAVEVDTEKGVIDGVTVNWTEDMVFPAAEGTADAEAARTAFFAANVPELVQARFYEEKSNTWSEKLCYRLGEDGVPAGLDAMTLEVIQTEEPGLEIIYEDEEEAGETALRLAEFGIGYADGAFRGQEEATLRDVLALILRAGGTETAQMEDDQLISLAMGYGILAPDEYDLDASVSRAWMARTLVEMSGYGKAAGLTDIYNVGFADAEQLTSEDMGYIAIARGMGVAVADSSGCFHPDRNITRGEAMQMLYAFLIRKI